MEIKEAYCSKEVCELLREKGFNVATEYVYLGDNKGKVAKSFTSHFVKKRNDIIPCPTHQMALAWLRKKGYSVEVHVTAVGWHWEVCKVNGKLIANGGACDDYDECTESALMYALTEVI